MQDIFYFRFEYFVFFFRSFAFFSALHSASALVASLFHFGVAEFPFSLANLSISGFSIFPFLTIFLVPFYFSLIIIYWTLEIVCQTSSAERVACGTEMRRDYARRQYEAASLWRRHNVNEDIFFFF